MTQSPLSTAYVLVVEDNDLARTILTTFLELHGHPARGVPHGAAALEFVRAAPALPKLILLDLAMPVMNGREFREAQLADPLLCDVPVMVVSAFSGAGPFGALDDKVRYHPKPVDYDLLLEQLAEL